MPKEEKNATPNDYFCPVSFSIFYHPVILLGSNNSCGHSIEKEVAEEILKSTIPKCPCCSFVFSALATNYMLKNAIDQFVEKNPTSKIDRYTPKNSSTKISTQHIYKKLIKEEMKGIASPPPSTLVYYPPIQQDDKKLLSSTTVQENEEIISRTIKTINKSIHACVWFSTDRLLTALPNNKVILACSHDWPKSPIYLIDPDCHPPSTPLLTIKENVTCVASCTNNNFFLGTEEGSIYLIESTKGNILMHQKVPHNVFGQRTIESINVFPNNDSCIVRSKQHLYAWSNFCSEEKPTASIPLKVSSNDSQVLLVSNSEGSYIIHGTRMSDVIEIYNAKNLALITTCKISASRNKQGIHIYFIKADPIDTNSFFIAYTHCHTDSPPMIVKGNLHTLNTLGLVPVIDLTSINSGLSIDNRFGIYMNESISLIPGGIIASNDKITAICQFGSPQTVKKFPTKKDFGLNGLTVLPDGRIFQIDNNGEYQCYMLKSVKDYLASILSSKETALDKSQFENNRNRRSP